MNSIKIIKKHPCPDCHFCQWCSDARCNLCKGWLPAASAKKKSSGTNVLTRKADKSLYAGIIYEKSVDNSATVTKRV
jgi:hypothetical protein